MLLPITLTPIQSVTTGQNYRTNSYFESIFASVKLNGNGLAKCNDVASDAQYSVLLEYATNQTNWLSVNATADAFDNHPQFVQLSQHIVDILASIIFSTNAMTLFGSFSNPRGVLMNYTPTQATNLAMNFHTDTPNESGRSIFTTVFTMKTEDCIGGELLLSNRSDGVVKHSRDVDVISLNDRSVYALFGSYGTHAVKPVWRGRRYAYVLFWDSFESIEYVIRNWLGIDHSVLVCIPCRKMFKSNSALVLHNHHKHSIFN